MLYWPAMDGEPARLSCTLCCRGRYLLRRDYAVESGGD